MLVGNCERGFERIRKINVRGDEFARVARQKYCPVEDSSWSPDGRLTAIRSQAVNLQHPWPSERCEEFRAQTERAIADAERSRAPSAAQDALGARYSVMTCFALADDCAHAVPIARLLYPDESAAKAAVSQLHPNCQK